MQKKTLYKYCISKLNVHEINPIPKLLILTILIKYRTVNCIKMNLFGVLSSGDSRGGGAWAPPPRNA